NGTEADRVIELGGRAISPGFIDVHSHSDFVLPLPDQADFLQHFVRQGITTIVVGNCGYAPAPINPDTADLMQAYTAAIKPRDLDWEWRTFGEFLGYLDDHGVYLNTVPLAAHELDDMKRMLAECMDSGAFGLSCGLIYAPGQFAPTEELVELGRGLRAH